MESACRNFIKRFTAAGIGTAGFTAANKAEAAVSDIAKTRRKKSRQQTPFRLRNHCNLQGMARTHVNCRHER